jgi:outer membrane immunogenic protein
MNLFARIAAAVALSVPGAAFAGGLVGPVTEPAVTTPYTPIAVAQPLGWGGAYAGGTIGYGRSRVGIELVPFEGISNPNGRGPSLGFFLGYNFELGNGMVLGVEGDVAWQRIRGDAAMFFPAPDENWTVGGKQNRGASCADRGGGRAGNAGHARSRPSFRPVHRSDQRQLGWDRLP